MNAETARNNAHTKLCTRLNLIRTVPSQAMQNYVPKYTDPALPGPAGDPNPAVTRLWCGKLGYPTGQQTVFGLAFDWRFSMRIAAFSDLHIWGPVPNWISVEFAG